MKRIILSAGSIVFVAALAISATGAYFSDTETSTGNTFTAGDIDLQIDNESYATDNTIPGFVNPTGALAFSAATSWDLKDLVPGVDHFFNFRDLKPGDFGEDTISIHVGSNDAWMCAAAQITSDLDNDITEPEDESALPAGDDLDGTGDGDLDSALNFVFWNDDGDNVYEPTCETQTPGCVPETIFLNGPLSGLGQADQITLADSVSSILGGTNPIPGDTTFYIGKAWCFGTLGTPGEDQDGIGKTGTGVGDRNGPLVRDEGITCDGSGEGNIAQTDSVVGDLQFYATQARNNRTFTCGGNYRPTWPEVVAPTLVGSNFALKTTATVGCTISVSSTSTQTTIAAGIAAAAPGGTICVEPGAYNESVNLNKDVTLVSTGGPGVTTINGGVDVNADGATVSGFRVTPGAIGVGPTMASFFVEDVADNATISDNDIDGTGVSNTGGTRGIILAEGGTFSNILIQNNSIHDFTSDIYVSTISGAGDPVLVKWNDIEVDTPADNGGGAAAGVGQLNDAVVTLNHFTSEVAGGEGVGAGGDYDATNLISFNNFLGGSRVNDYSAPGLINAENNFWNTGGVNQTTAAEVDFTPEAGVAYGHR